MISFFILCHNLEVFFELSDEEWNKAVKENPVLNNTNCKLTFYERSASGWLEPGKDNYIDNEVIMQQFERLFILLEYKKCFENADIEILVDTFRQAIRFNEF